MRTISLRLKNEEETKKLACSFAKYCTPPLIITLQGNLGVGKTTFIRALLKSMGVESTIKSPSFSIVETYTLENLYLHHFDLYRMKDPEELEYIGFRDYQTEHSILCIEWPEHGEPYIPQPDLVMHIQHQDTGRLWEISGHTEKGNGILISADADRNTSESPPNPSEPRLKGERK